MEPLPALLPSGPGCPARALGQKRVLRSAPLASERSLQTHLCMDPTRSDPSTRWGWGRDPEGLGWGVTLAGCVTSGRTLTSLCWQPHLWHQHNAGPVSLLGRLADKTQLPLLCTLPCLSPASPPSSAPLSTVAFPAIHMANSSLQRLPGPPCSALKKIFFYVEV